MYTCKYDIITSYGCQLPATSFFVLLLLLGQAYLSGRIHQNTAGCCFFVIGIGEYNPIQSNPILFNSIQSNLILFIASSLSFSHAYMTQDSSEEPI